MGENIPIDSKINELRTDFVISVNGKKYYVVTDHLNDMAYKSPLLKGGCWHGMKFQDAYYLCKLLDMVLENVNSHADQKLDQDQIL